MQTLPSNSIDLGLRRLQGKSSGGYLKSIQQTRALVLRSFVDPFPEVCLSLERFSNVRWKSMLRWLDTSGLALYFFDRLREVNGLHILPSAVVARLERNLADNMERTAAMIHESIALQERFLCAGLSYAVLKGHSLWPVSVPKLELRSQLDLDFLVAEHSAARARHFLEERGYRLHAVSGQSWEFKADEDRCASLIDLYKSGTSRSIELHIEGADRERASRLDRTCTRSFHGLQVPVLSPVDLFLSQGLHLHKHICSEFSRTAHLIEFRHHVIELRDDETFWRELRGQVSSNRGDCIRLGVVISSIAETMGPFAPAALTCWTVDQTPSTVIRWVKEYGARTVLADFPGSKLYLLLQIELEALGVQAQRSLLKSLLPRRLPPAMALAIPHESLFVRIVRHLRQIRFIAFRLRFHTVEGIRLLSAWIRWRRLREGQS